MRDGGVSFLENILTSFDFSLIGSILLKPLYAQPISICIIVAISYHHIPLLIHLQKKLQKVIENLHDLEIDDKL